MLNLARFVAVPLMLAAFGSPALAADRALIIGIGNYSSPDARLPGIDKDVAQASDIANRLGFANPVVLVDQQATRRGILTALKAALIENAGASDRVFIYFSGHGAPVFDLNGDETDSQDEALLAADFQILADGQGGTQLRGAVIDDEIGDLIAKSPSRNIMLVIDACHSGTVDRSIRLGRPLLGESQAVAKYFPVAKDAKLDRSFVVSENGSGNDASDRYVALNAAGDHEQAIATPNGSAFTVGLAQAIKEKSASGTVTPAEMVSIASDYVHSRLSGNQRFTPQIQGSAQLRQQGIRLTSTSNGGGPNWRRVEEVARGLPGLAITNVKDRYVEGEPLEIEIDVRESGYLNVINVGPDDATTLLFPNAFNPDNRVEAGKLRLPTPQMKFNLTAQAPFGKSMILAILTRKPVNLAQSATDANSSAALNSPALGTITSLSSDVSSSRSFAATPRSDASAWAAKIETLVCRSAAEPCQ